MNTQRMVLLVIILCPSFVFAKTNYLNECRKKQADFRSSSYLQFSFKESTNRTYHSFKPWQTYSQPTFGKIWINDNSLLKLDSIKGKTKTSVALIQFDPSALLITNFGDTSYNDITKSDYNEYTFESARYSPALLINYFNRTNAKETEESGNELAVYSTNITKNIVKLYIRKDNYLAEKVTVLSNDNIYGDVLTTFFYDNYSVLGNISFPQFICVKKLNGMVYDTVTYFSSAITHDVPPLVKKPDNYVLKPDAVDSSDFITISKFSDHIHFVSFTRADSKAMVVEFYNFLLVAESPLTSANGELLIRAVHEIAPNKPIKYFTYGHWHPWYLGGVRPFIHNGAKIICPECDSTYIPYLANAKHTLDPDSLSLQPKVLQTEILRDSMTISDGKYSMKIFLIGKESDHTEDYTIFYFPEDKMVFEGDLAWIKKDGAISKPSSRQVGLYNSIKSRKLDVVTVVQAWPIKKYGIKSEFRFSEFEEAIKIK